MKNTLLFQYRDELNKIDDKILDLINKRFDMAKQIGDIKNKFNDKYTDVKRENLILDSLFSLGSNDLLADAITKIYTQFFDYSKHIRSFHYISQQKISIGIIGYGRFGKTMYNIFKKHMPNANVYVYSRSAEIDNKKFYDIEQVCKTDWLFPCVPISVMQDNLKNIKKYLNGKTIVIDVCSVKVKPVQWMKSILKGHHIIATHPMFGPDSTVNGKYLYNVNMMMCNISADKKRYEIFKSFWVSLGTNVVEIIPQEHDKYAAYTICYNHLIGRIGEKIGIKNTPIDTKGFKVIYDALTYVVNDTWQLFVDMQNYNPYAKKMRKDVIKAISEIEKKLK